MARLVFKTMVGQVLERMPVHVVDAAGTVHHESVGVIKGVQHLPARFTPGKRLGASLDGTIAHWQKVIDDQGLAKPITAS